VTPQATTNVLLIVTFMGIFQHTNVKTPQWLGYLIQRPESHTIHHARWMHRSNYSDLPLIDMLFGTFENPKTYQHETGLHPGASGRLFDLLSLRDVSEPKAAPARAKASAASPLVDSTS
jgi:sterol desaturase/sphingolipid hydroxylase (fatty acid hydroxylase superfamily)